MHDQATDKRYTPLDHVEGMEQILEILPVFLMLEILEFAIVWFLIVFRCEGTIYGEQ